MEYKNIYKRIHVVEGEKIEMVIYHHFLPHLHRMIFGMILLLLPFFFMFVLFAQGNIGIAIFALLIFVGVYYNIRQYFVWSRNVFVVTNKKIVDIDQKGFFSKTVSEVGYDKIVDIYFTSKGMLSTLFDFGTIYVKTSIPNTTLMISHVGDVKNITGHIIEISKESGMIASPEISTKQKVSNFEEVLNYDESDPIHQESLKDLLEKYVDIYSKDRLKRLLIEEIKKEEEGG